MPHFIFMLTRDDLTVPDARDLYSSVSDAGVEHYGCKDVGLPLDQVSALIEDIRGAGHTSWLEVVSESEDATLASAVAAARIRPDYLVGGTLIEPVQAIIAGTGIRFFPYAGDVLGHPCILRGEIEQICESARRAEAAGVDGINLLAYRWDGDVPALVARVCEAVSIPVICAGSIDSVDRVRELAGLGIWGFTIGTAALDGKLIPDRPLADQLAATLQAADSSGAPTTP